MIWSRLRQWLKREPAPDDDAGPSPKWHEPGPTNPFGVRLLDCRPLTWSWISVTGDPEIAQRYTALRQSDGRDLIDSEIEDAVRVPASIVLPHNGAPLEGIASKADSMEVKWDTYIYDSTFLFARSWSGELRYRASAIVGERDIRIAEIECCSEDVDLAPSTVYFLLVTHAMGRPFPHQIPPELAQEDPTTIATWSFGHFGKMACYATAEDITSIPLPGPPPVGPNAESESQDPA